MRTQVMKTLRPLTLASLAAIAALSGCRIEKPATVVPAPPTVESFTASATTVAAGAKVTLSWKTSNATAIELRETSTGALSVPATTLEGTVEATVDQNSLFVLVARGAGGADARALSVTVDRTGASTVTFQALPPTIPGGTSTTLVWTAPGAKVVTLTAGAALDTQGQLTAGAVTVKPNVDTTYTLTADGQVKTVTVTVQPALLSLEATPRAVAVGDTVTLSWTAAGAEKIVVSSPGRGQLAEITDPAKVLAGTYADVVPTLPANAVLAYEVAAVKGTATLSRTLEVFVGTGLQIVRFDAPPVAAATLPYSVRWQTLAADRVEVKVDGVTVHETATATEATNGQYSFVSPAQDFAVELVVTNTRGARLSQLAQVDSVGVPTAATLTASPTSVTAGQPVTLTFASTEARRVRISDSTGQNVFSTTGQRAEMGSVIVYPNADTTYSLSADNLLGNPAVTATAQVTVTGTPLVVTQFPPTAISGQNVQLSTSQAGALFIGFPHNQVLTSSQANFIDIRATGTKLLEAGGSVTTVELPFSTWLWGKRQTGPITISRAGWFAWGAPVVVNSAETTLPSTSSSAAPGLIAPYWDDLTLTANSGVYVALVGEAPEQQLVVQWDHLQCGTTTNTEATFQARVHQNGSVSFHYLTMTLNSAPSFTIGLQDTTRALAVRSTGTPTSNTARYFFSPITGPVETRVSRGSSWGGFVKVGEALTLVSRTAAAFSVPLDLSVTEIMFRPSAAVPNGQYVEVINRTGQALDLSGWELRSATSPTFSVTNGFTLAPGVPTLLGTSIDPVENDDAGVALAWGSFSLSPDAGTFVLGTADAGASLSYAGLADAGRGTAFEVDPGPIVGTTGTAGTRQCASASTFGSQTPLQQGSPGLDRGCFAYKMVSIPVNYRDISDGGTALANGDNVITTVTFAPNPGDPAPVLFGTPAPIVSVSSNGYIVRGTVASGTNTNKIVAGSTNAGSVAVFWDDLSYRATNGGLFWKRVAAGEDATTPAAHWIVQWAHYSYWTGTPADDMNFEAKLFEDGTVEYHFAAMTSGNSSNYAAGTFATTWLENTLGTEALAPNIENGRITPNTAYRFIPR